MATIKRPQAGERVLQSLYDSVISIIDYLPTLTVRGDNYSTSVEHSSLGTVVHVKQNANPDQAGGKKNYYFAGSGLTLASGNVFNVEVDNSTVKIVDNKLSCVVSGGGGGGGTTVLCGDFGYPNYFAMSDVDLANVANYVPCGIGVSWVLPVSAGTRPCFYSTAGDGTAFGVFTSDVNEPNPQRIQMSNGIPVAPSTNGWCRISVFDNGASEGSCLRFTSQFPTETPSYDYWNYTTPLYRYHGFRKYSPDNQTVFINQSGMICANVWQYTGLGDITVDNENHTISYDGSGGGDVDLSWKLSHPDYQALRNGEYGNVSGQGISFLLPLQSGHAYQFYAPNGDGKVWGTFATSLDNEDYYRVDNIANGIDYTPSADGWLRVSVFDDGYNEGECLRLYKNKTEYSEGMPLYRFGSAKKLTPDNETVFISSAGIISSNVWQYSGSGVIDVDNTNHIISFTGTLPEGDFKAPDFAKLQVTNDAGETTLGLGTTYLVPVSNGSTVRYEADGGTIIARWAPVEGSSENAFAVTTTNKSTTDDGYVRISVIDAGTLSSGCVRLYVNNKALPLHKFAMFNYSSGAIYQGGRYINIATEETQIVNDVPVQVPLLNPIISCTLTGGNYVEIQERDSNNNLLEFPRINCTLSEGEGIEITSTGIINCTKTSTLSTVRPYLAEGSNIKLIEDENTGITTISGAAGGGGAEYTGISPIVVNNSNHTISYTGSAGGVPWPNYAALANNGTSISIQQDYTVGSAGGWLRVSYKGTPQQQGSEYCYSIMIDGNAIGMYTLNSALGMMGNTWILPIPPFSRFMVNFPTSNTNAYFDGSLYDSGDIQEIYATIIDYCNQAKEACDYAEDQYDDAKGKGDWAENDYTVYSQNDPPNIDPPRDYWNNYWYARAYTNGWVNPNDSDDYICGAVQYAAEAADWATLAQTEATRMIGADEDVLNRANDYALSASNCATNANNWVTAASGEADRVYNWYLSACQLSGQTPHPKNYADKDQ